MKTGTKTLAALSIAVLSLASTSPRPIKSPRAPVDFESWVTFEAKISETKLFANISPAGAVPGVILASPSKKDPNYYYYWVRDGALSMQAVLDLYNQGSNQALPALETFLKFTRDNQARAFANLGEPRFNTDGNVNTEPWGRPQNDGPALRALMFMRFANRLLLDGKRTYVETNLYSAALPGDSVIKTDLEFTAHHWQEKSVDLWEEVWGHHFFTEAAQYAALKDGAAFAMKLGDPGAAAFYLEQSQLLEKQLMNHWSEDKGYYLATLEFSASPDHVKDSQLDVSVILAALAADQDTGVLNVSDDRILKTAVAVEDAFKKIYAINQDPATLAALGPAIGRYQEDVYFDGNPWYLTTAAYAEMNFKIATQVAKSKSFVLTDTQARYFVDATMKTGGSPLVLKAGLDLAQNQTLKNQVVKALRDKADLYLQRVRYHTPKDGSLAEQFRRGTGIAASARDLSWSYASVLGAIKARKNAAAADPQPIVRHK